MNEEDVRDEPKENKTFFRVTFICTAALPLFAAVGFAFWLLMPSCTGGSGDAPTGCTLLGINLNWLITLTILAAMGSVIAIPIGIALMLIGALVVGIRGK